MLGRVRYAHEMVFGQQPVLCVCVRACVMWGWYI